MSEVGTLLEEYRAAVRAKDVDRFVAIFADDVRVFDMWATWSHDGIDSWREMAEGWFGSLGDELVRVEFDDVQTIVGEDAAVLSAFVTFAGLSADGEELRSMNNRQTWGPTSSVDHARSAGGAEMRQPASQDAGRASALVTRPTCAAVSAGAATNPRA